MKLAQTLIALTWASTVRGFALVSHSVAARAAPVATTTTSPRSAIRMMSTASPMDFAKSEIADNKVVVFSKSYCPFCLSTKNLLNDKGVEYALYELNQMDGGDDIQDALLEISGQRTVPNVFINGKHVGGNSDLQDAAKSGKLDELLAAAK